MASIWDRFEYKAVVCYTGYKDRYSLLQKELERVGMKDVQPHWDFPNPFNQALVNVIPMTKFNRNRSCFFIGLNNYRAVATAYHLGCRNCLVMEDDIRFLRDIDKIAETVASLPTDYDLAMFDCNKPCALSLEAYLNIFKHQTSPCWSRFTNLRSTGCYAMSRKGMEAWLRAFESPANRIGELRNPDGYFRVEYLGSDKNLYVANPPIAIQKQFETTHCSGSRMAEYYALREKIGSKGIAYGD